MRYINKLKFASIFTCITLFLNGCGGSFSQPYTINSYSSNSSGTKLETFASDLCVVNSDIQISDVVLSENSCGGLFDLNKRETLFAKSVHERLNPASLTKVMTALVALKYGDLSQTLKATSNVNITESGAQKIGLQVGDTMTLDQALHLLLIYSANDVAMLIAENIGGTLDQFYEMMNNEAAAIGATNSHFVNPHGLTADDHYVTCYDMYLIFNAAMQYDEFQEIISLPEYSTIYYSSDGTGVDVNIKSTNQYFNGNQTAPTGITVIGGKTGTTTAAGHCLILLAKDTSGNPYIAVVLRAEDTSTLYEEMAKMLASVTGN